MGRIYNNIVETVGRTPLVRLNLQEDRMIRTAELIELIDQ